MTRSYTKQEVIKYLKKYIDNPKKRLPKLYKATFIRHYGETSGIKDKKERYYDVVAHFLINQVNIVELFKNNIKKISRHERGKKYKVEGHSKLNIEEKKKILSNENANEKLIARCLLEKNIEQIGEIIDYEIPIKNRLHQPIGAIDLLSYKDGMISLIEFKKPSNEETLLRAILEISTYCEHIKEIDELKNDFGYLNANVQKVVLIFNQSFLHKQLESESIRKLAEKLDVKIITIDRNILECP